MLQKRNFNLFYKIFVLFLTLPVSNGFSEDKTHLDYLSEIKELKDIGKIKEAYALSIEFLLAKENNQLLEVPENHIELPKDELLSATVDPYPYITIHEHSNPEDLVLSFAGSLIQKKLPFKGIEKLPENIQNKLISAAVKSQELDVLGTWIENGSALPESEDVEEILISHQATLESASINTMEEDTPINGVNNYQLNDNILNAEQFFLLTKNSSPENKKKLFEIALNLPPELSVLMVRQFAKEKIPLSDAYLAFKLSHPLFKLYPHEILELIKNASSDDIYLMLSTFINEGDSHNMKFYLSLFPDLPDHLGRLGVFVLYSGKEQILNIENELNDLEDRSKKNSYSNQDSQRKKLLMNTLNSLNKSMETSRILVAHWKKIMKREDTTLQEDFHFAFTDLNIFTENEKNAKNFSFLMASIQIHDEYKTFFESFLLSIVKNNDLSYLKSFYESKAIDARFIYYNKIFLLTAVMMNKSIEDETEKQKITQWVMQFDGVE